jgi:hypothetical protein
VLAALFALAVAAVGPAAALEPINRTAEELALDGYDAVAYFDEGKPLKGSTQYTHRWQGATWRFATAARRDRFAAEPERFAPQFGGYCAWAVSHGYTADADPEAWAIVDGKLYLNYNRDVQKEWSADRAALIVAGNANWPKLLAGELPKK